jgi:hypothetical protein
MRQSEWYYQCMPGAGGDSGGPGSSSTGGGSSDPGSSGSTVPLWGQCGGYGGECSKHQCADAPFPGEPMAGTERGDVAGQWHTGSCWRGLD